MIPSRTRSVCDDRHQIRNPYAHNLPSNIDAWGNTLLKTRIPDLFRTRQGLEGHVVQLQNELNRINKVEHLTGDVVAHATGVMRRIYGAVEKAVEAAEQSSDLGLPAHLSLYFPLIQNEIHF